MNNIQKLTSMGCGQAIINSQIDRGNIQAAMHNANKMLKYYTYAVKSGLYTKEHAIEGLIPYLNALKSVEGLANVYQGLYKEKFYKIKLQIEKFTN